MGRIALADIPNAPQAAPMPQGDAHSVNFSTAASLLHQDGIAQGAFDGPAKGMQALGEGIANAGQGIGGTLEKIATVKEEADYSAKVNQADSAMRQAHTAYTAQIAQTPGMNPDDVVPGWQKVFGDTTKQLLADKTLTPRSRTEIMARAARFGDTTTAPLALEAAKMSFARSKASFIQRKDENLKDGNLPAALEAIDAGKDQMVFFPEEAEGIKQHTRQQYEYQQASTAIGVDPIVAREVLLEKDSFPNISPSQRDSLSTDAEREIVSRTKQRFEYVAAGIKSGDVADLAHAMDIGGEYFGKTEEMKIKTMLDREAPLSYATLAGVRDRANQLDPTMDTTGQARFEVERDAIGLPDPFRQRVMKEIADKYDGPKPEALRMADVKQTLNQALRSQLFGTFDNKEADAGNVEEYNKREAAQKTKLQFEDEMSDWIKAHPGSSETEKHNHLLERFRDKGLLNVKQGFDWSSLFKWFSVGSVPLGTASSDAKAKNAAKALDDTTAQQFLKHANGDKAKAREAARAAGYQF